jgi:four helix bundle protein
MIAVSAIPIDFSQRNRFGMPLAHPGAMREWIDRLEERTAQFAADVISLCKRLRHIPGLENASKQLIESSNSVASNHLAMRRGRSDREFASKQQIVTEEIAESVGWLELIDKVLAEPDATARDLLREARELRAIFAKGKKTMRGRLEKEQRQRRRE